MVRFVQRVLGRDLPTVVDVACDTIHLGTEYGGQCVSPADLGPESVVYTFGLGDDISFDLELIKRFGSTVYGFDPTPRSIQWVKAQDVPPQFHLQEYGLANYDGVARFSPPENPDHISHTLLDRPETSNRAIEVPVKRFETIATELGHEHLTVLKLDIEGAEFDVLDDILESGVVIDQLLVEFHHRFKNVSRAMTRDAIGKIRDRGYQIFEISPTGRDYSFLRS